MWVILLIWGLIKLIWEVAKVYSKTLRAIGKWSSVFWCFTVLALIEIVRDLLTLVLLIYGLTARFFILLYNMGVVVYYCFDWTVLLLSGTYLATQATQTYIGTGYSDFIVFMSIFYGVFILFVLPWLIRIFKKRK